MSACLTNWLCLWCVGLALHTIPRKLLNFLVWL